MPERDDSAASDPVVHLEEPDDPPPVLIPYDPSPLLLNPINPSPPVSNPNEPTPPASIPNDPSPPAASAAVTPPVSNSPVVAPPQASALAQNPNKLYRCSFCQFNSRNGDNLKTHIKDLHKKEMTLWCKDCAKHFNSADRLLTHMNTDCIGENVYNFFCGFPDCNYRNTEPSEFSSHIRVFHRGKPLIPCFHCKTVFTIPYCLITHIQESCEKRSNIPPNAGGASNHSQGPGYNPARAGPSGDQNKKDDKVETPKTPKGCSKEAEKSNSFMFDLKRKLANEKAKSKAPLFSDSESDPDDPSWKVSKPKNRTKRTVTTSSSENESDTPYVPGPKGRTTNRRAKNSKRINNNNKANSSKETDEDDDTDPIGDADGGTTDELKIDSPPRQIEKKIQKLYDNWTEWHEAFLAIKKEDVYVEKKMEHFFKCMDKCTFTTYNDKEFEEHLETHLEEEFYCSYCLESFPCPEKLVKHLISTHRGLNFQCSKCFYRAITKPHVNIHIDTFHLKQGSVLTCQSISNLLEKPLDSDSQYERSAKRYGCRIGSCTFATFSTDDFRKHYKTQHAETVTFPCHFCCEAKSSMSDLLIHLRQHNINETQCSFCFFGSDSTDIVVQHFCINHRDRDLKIFVRTRSEDSSSDSDSAPSPPSNNESMVDKTFAKNLPKRVINFDKNIKCKINKCDMVLMNLARYRDHLMKFHHSKLEFNGKSGVEYLCPHCQVVSNNPSEAIHHIRLHGANLYACKTPGCGFYHWEKSFLIEHRCTTSSSVQNVATIRKEKGKQSAIEDDLLLDNSSDVDDPNKDESPKGMNKDVVINKDPSPKKDVAAAAVVLKKDNSVETKKSASHDKENLPNNPTTSKVSNISETEKQIAKEPKQSLPTSTKADKVKDSSGNSIDGQEDVNKNVNDGKKSSTDVASNNHSTHSSPPRSEASYFDLDYEPFLENSSDSDVSEIAPTSSNDREIPEKVVGDAAKKPTELKVTESRIKGTGTEANAMRPLLEANQVQPPLEAENPVTMPELPVKETEPSSSSDLKIDEGKIADKTYDSDDSFSTGSSPKRMRLDTSSEKELEDPTPPLNNLKIATISNPQSSKESPKKIRPLEDASNTAINLNELTIINQTPKTTLKTKFSRTVGKRMVKGNVTDDEQGPSTSSSSCSPPDRATRTGGSKNSKIICFFCNSFLNTTFIKEHIFKEMNYGHFKCNFCENQFHREATLRRHFDVNHPNEAFVVTKHTVQHIEDFASSYIAAQQQATGSQRLQPKQINSESRVPLHCCMCDLQAANVNHLEDHLRKHLQYKPFVCNHCEQSFSSVSQVKEHTFSQHKRLIMGYNLKTIQRVENWIKTAANPIATTTTATPPQKIRRSNCARKSTGGGVKRKHTEPEPISYYKKKPVVDFDNTFLYVEGVRLPILYYKDVIKFDLRVVCKDVRRRNLF